MVIPETGFDDEPMRPTMRLATVTKKNPKTTISRPSSSLLPTPGARDERQERHHQHQDHRADQHDGDRQVALGAGGGRGVAVAERRHALA